MKFAILDDESYYHERLKELLLEHGCTAECSSFYGAESFFACKEKKEFDAVFLDVEMPGMNGISAAQRMRQEEMNCIVIFVTNHPDTVFQAFGLNVLAFLQKDRLEQELDTVLEKLNSELLSRKTLMIAMYDHSVVSIEPNMVLYCEVVLRKVYLQMKDHTRYRLQETQITRMYELFRDAGFLFVNRSCFVNVSEIRALESERLFLNGCKEPIYISRGKYQDVRRAYIDHF